MHVVVLPGAELRDQPQEAFIAFGFVSLPSAPRERDRVAAHLAKVRELLHPSSYLSIFAVTPRPARPSHPSPCGQRPPLTPRNGPLLQALLRHPGRVAGVPGHQPPRQPEGKAREPLLREPSQAVTPHQPPADRHLLQTPSRQVQ